MTSCRGPRPCLWSCHASCLRRNTSDRSRNTVAIVVIAAILGHSAAKPRSLANTPTVIGWYHADGKLRPRIFAVPESDDTGASRPDRLIAGTIERIAVANTAATWVWVNDDTSCPNPVVAIT